MDRLFVTGAGGFVGSRLVDELERRGIEFLGLTRSSSLTAVGGESSRLVRGDLLEPSTFERALASSDAVVHLAAATGKSRPSECHEVNITGTRVLLEQCKKHGVGRFLFVSTIAVKFPDKSHYCYAQSKEAAEALVKDSGLDFTIVRPTIVVGRQSPPLLALGRLASLPVIPIFGDGRARVQPIFVDDLVDFIVELVEEPRYRGETLELGGPDVVDIETFLEDIRRARGGRRARTIHVPFGPTAALLTALEKVAFSLAPVTVGQLSSFRFDGVVENNPVLEKRRDSLRSIPRMLELSFSG